MNFFDKFVSEHHVIKCGLGDHSDHSHGASETNIEVSAQQLLQLTNLLTDDEEYADATIDNQTEVLINELIN